MISLLFHSPPLFIAFATAFLAALTIHEFSHGYAAYMLGDDTAKRQGRLTLNPLKHLDVFGTLMILFAGIGWAKPVPFNPYNFKEIKIGSALTAAAGPASNFILATFTAIIIRLLPEGTFGHTVTTFAHIFHPNASFITISLFLFVHVNILLGCFNLLPVPPLDGSKIIGGFLPDNMYFKWMSWESKAGMVLMIVLLIGVFTGRSIIFMIIGPPMEFIRALLLG